MGKSEEGKIRILAHIRRRKEIQHVDRILAYLGTKT